MTRGMMKLLALGEAVAEVAGADCSPERVTEALRLLDRLERMAAEYGDSGPRATAARIVALGEVAEAAIEELGIRPVEMAPAGGRARQGEHLLQLVERYAARVAAEGWTERTDVACLHIFPPLPDEGLWEVADSAVLCFRSPIQAETLAEAVDKALEELGKA